MRSCWIFTQLRESDSVIQGGREFLRGFSGATQRTTVALLMADAYARNGDPKDEFAIYDAVLQELAVKRRTFHWDFPGRRRRHEHFPAETEPEQGAEGMQAPQAETAGESSAPRRRAGASFRVGVCSAARGGWAALTRICLRAVALPGAPGGNE